MATLSYPGVYVDEVSSGVHAITGVATSITAFVGRAKWGPVDTATTITCFADFERGFGGLWTESQLGYAVQDFYRHGGGTAVIVRVHKRKGAVADTATLTVGGLHLAAISPGAWGAKLTAATDLDVKDTASGTHLNLTITEPASGRIEVFRNISVDPADAKFVTKVLADQSNLVQVDGTAVTPVPAAAAASGPQPAKATGGDDGDPIDKSVITPTGPGTDKKGLRALEDADLINLLVIPPYTGADDIEVDVSNAARKYALDRDAIFVMDPSPDWHDANSAATAAKALAADTNAAMYFPRIRRPDPLRDGQIGTFAPSGAIAGIMARTDATRGVWKAPAGLEATLSGVTELDVPLTDNEIGQLNPLGLNCLRRAPGVGPVVWGARTRDGADRLASEWKYLPVRRTSLFLKVSLLRGTQWVVFEPNAEPLWAQIRLNLGAFMHTLFRQGAFAGTTPKEAYYVKCDKETTTADDANQGIVNILVGFAPLKPAEFVVIKLQQMAGQAGGA